MVDGKGVWVKVQRKEDTCSAEQRLDWRGSKKQETELERRGGQTDLGTGSGDGHTAGLLEPR